MPNCAEQCLNCAVCQQRDSRRHCPDPYRLRNSESAAFLSNLSYQALSRFYSPYEVLRDVVESQLAQVLIEQCVGDVQRLCHNFLLPVANFLHALKNAVSAMRGREGGSHCPC